MSQLPKHLLDLEQLHQISEGDIEFEIEVLQVYVEDVSQRLGIIRESCLSGDRTPLMAEAHHVKGSSSNVGALPIRDLAAQIEKLGKSDDLSQVSEEISNLIDQILALIRQIEEFVIESAANLGS